MYTTTPLDVMDLHLAELAKRKLLTAQEEVDLAKAMIAGMAAANQISNKSIKTDHSYLDNLISKGKEARATLINHNLRLVVSIAKKYRNRGLAFTDLVQEGNVGLTVAADKYDHTKGFRFSTYATWWIRQAIGRAVANYGRVIRLPVNWHSSLNKLNYAHQELEQQYQRRPTHEELAAHTDMSIEKVQTMLTAKTDVIPLEQPKFAGEQGEFGDFIEDKVAVQPDEALAEKTLAGDMEAMLAELPAREALVLTMRYGLKGDKPQNYRVIGEHLGLSRERVRQIESQARKHLRMPHIAQKLKPYLN